MKSLSTEKKYLHVRGFTLVEVMITIGIVLILAALVFPNVLRARVNANEANAQATLRTISTALESYAAANSGNYPDSIDDLTGGNPPYLSFNPIGTSHGYTFACGTLITTGYSCTATAASCNNTGNNNYTMTTGKILAQTTCIVVE